MSGSKGLLRCFHMAGDEVTHRCEAMAEPVSPRQGKP